MSTHTSTNRGFTLIELMIAIGIFSIFLIIITGVFTKFVQTERHNIVQGSLVLDLQSAMESFIKEARTGYGSTYTMTLGGKGVAFRNQAGVCVSYRLNPVDGEFGRAEDPLNLEGECEEITFASIPFTPLTGNGTRITEVFFDVTKSEKAPTPPYPPYSILNQGVITLTLKANSTKLGVLPLSIQNTVTSRQVRSYDE